MSELLSPIVGRMDCTPQTKTAQSATRIGFITPIEKFLAEKEIKNLPRIDLLKAWTKRHRVFTDDGKVMKQLRKYYAEQLIPHIPKSPYIGCFELTVVFTFPWPKSTPKRITQNSKFSYKVTTPDSDNMLKAFKDSLERTGIVANDSMIARDIVEKRLGPKPGISWRLRPLMEHQPLPGLFPGEQ